MPRIVVMGCGTAVGKTRIAVALLRRLKHLDCACVGLKPIESGIAPASSVSTSSDAAALSLASTSATSLEHPLYAFEEPISPHLAARRMRRQIDLDLISRWVESAEGEVTPLVSSSMAHWSVVETAGGVFTPLSATATNFDLGIALEPAIWIVVGSDSLGVLHDLSATLQAMKARGRTPEHVVLSAAREPDASTGSNAPELRTLRIAAATAVLGRDDDRGIQDLVGSLLRGETASPETRLP